MNNKINIDTSFLDKNEENENFSRKENYINNYDYYKNKKNNDSGNKGLPWGWIIFIGIIALILIFSDDSSNTSNYSSSTSNNEYNLGEYRCYSSSYNEALSMEPVDPGLDNMANEIERLETELKNTYVNEYSQSSVDSYNSKIRILETKINTYNIDLENYNKKIDEYNNFLENNCSK